MSVAKRHKITSVEKQHSLVNVVKRHALQTSQSDMGTVTIT